MENDETSPSVPSAAAVVLTSGRGEGGEKIQGRAKNNKGEKQTKLHRCPTQKHKIGALEITINDI
jgi:hypothetical protein